MGAAAKPQVPGCGGMRACSRVLPIRLRLYSNAGNGRFLRGYDGHLQGDAYSGHDATAQRKDGIEVGRWDHARRYFFNGSDEDSSVGAQLLAHIKRLPSPQRTRRARRIGWIGFLRRHSVLSVLSVVNQLSWSVVASAFYLVAMPWTVATSPACRVIRYFEFQWDSSAVYKSA